MITGIHAILYSKHADELRAFLRDVLGLESVDAGGGWPIFAGPPLELAVHPTDDAPEHELYLMCDDINAAVANLRQRGLKAAPIEDRNWGLLTSIELADGERIGLYEPRHPSPLRAQ
jgi:catechol 2,3-dioxygenase-like lactoylglutathione lyase family enzyme